MLVDVGQLLAVQAVIVTTNLRPDLVLWSNLHLIVYIVEPTVPWEDAVEETFERAKLHHLGSCTRGRRDGLESKGLPRSCMLGLFGDVKCDERPGNQWTSATLGIQGSIQVGRA